MPEHASRQIWTIGHSTRSWDDFVALLRTHGVEAVADVRRFPGSRKHPQFNGDAMRDALQREGVAYAHFPELGGRRAARKDSANTAWRNAAFRGYADYMETREFQAGMARLAQLARSKRTAIMCAAQPSEHPYTGAASIVDGRLSYQQPLV